MTLLSKIKLPKHERQERQHDIANCYFNAQSLAGGLATLGLTAAKASYDCKSQDKEDDQQNCAADIATIISEMAGVIGSAATVASTCPVQEVEDADCVATAADIVDSAAIFAAFGAAV